MLMTVGAFYLLTTFWFIALLIVASGAGAVQLPRGSWLWALFLAMFIATIQIVTW